jgi:hypothetical protein
LKDASDGQRRKKFSSVSSQLLEMMHKGKEEFRSDYNRSTSIAPDFKTKKASLMVKLSVQIILGANQPLLIDFCKL